MQKVILIFLLSLFLQGCSVIKPGWIKESQEIVEEQESDDTIEGVEGPTGGHFNEDGEWVPNNPEIEITYKIPDISTGFLLELPSLQVTPTLSVELFEFDTHIPYVERIKFDVGVGHQRTFLYVGKLWTSIFEISTGGFVGWNWEDEEITYGVSLTIIKF